MSNPFAGIGFNAGNVVLAGRPNVGKSSLINKLLDYKVSIVSEKPQTTRNVIRCVYNGDGFQIVFTDTPGIHLPKHKLGRALVDAALESLEEADLVCYVVEAEDRTIGPEDEEIIAVLRTVRTPLLLVVNKCDVVLERKGGGEAALAAVRSLYEARLPLCGAVFVVLSAVFFRGKRSSSEEFRLSGAAIRAYLFRSRSVLILLAGFLYAATQTGLAAWLVRYMTLRYNAETLGSTALSIYWVCATISRFAAPRIPMRPLKLFLCGVLASVVFQTIGVLSGSAVIMCVMSGLVGLVTGLCIPMLVSENAAGQEGNTSLATSILLVTMCFARMLAPIVMGSLSSGISVSASMLLPAVTAALAGLFAFLALRQDGK